MRRGIRRWWVIALFIVVVAAAATAALLLLTGKKSATVHYLTSTATMGTIAKTVQANFTLADANGGTTIALGGTSSSTSSSSGSSGSSGSSATTASATTTGSTTTFISAISNSVSSPTPTLTSTPTPTPTLTLMGFTPTAGPVGSTVTLFGTDLSGTTAVNFNGRTAFFKAESDTQVTALVPAGARSGPITITSSGSTATSAIPFTVTPTPTPTPSKSRTPSPTPSASKSGGGGGSSTGSAGASSSGSAGASSSSGSTVSSGTSGVVTAIAFAAGKAPATLQRLLSISGKRIYAFVSTTPLYETLSVNLSSGAQKTNVATLQRALKAAGCFSGTVNGEFGSSTETALEDWQADQGLSQTGTITTSQFVWVPKGAVIESWKVALGNSVSSGTALATIDFPRDLIAQALVTQADISSLKVGQKAALTIDGATSDSFTGTITSISSQPASSSSAGGSSSTVKYTVNLVPYGLPSLAKSGMTGTLTITIASRKNVLLVPTSAVSGTSSSAFVRVMQNGKPTYRQVTAGMTTSSLTQITSGLAAGEVVVTGQYSNSATRSTGTSGGFGGLGGGLPSGGFPRIGGGAGGGQ
jgi:hypothetical protein